MGHARGALGSWAFGGTRSHPGCPECFGNTTTAPPPPDIRGVLPRHGPALLPATTLGDDRGMPRAAALVASLALALGSLHPLTPGEAAGDWRWPVDPPRAILRPYLAPATPYSSGHRGIDIAAPTGVLYAPEAGVVHFAGVVVDRPVLSLRHGDGVISSFEPVIAAVAEGDRVERGQPIGSVVPGHCSVLCVHVGVRVDGQYRSPLAWFGAIPPSVLLPTRTASERTSGPRSPPRYPTGGFTRPPCSPSRRAVQTPVSCRTRWCAPLPQPTWRGPATRTSPP